VAVSKRKNDTAIYRVGKGKEKISRNKMKGDDERNCKSCQDPEGRPANFKRARQKKESEKNCPRRGQDSKGSGGTKGPREPGNIDLRGAGRKNCLLTRVKQNEIM